MAMLASCSQDIVVPQPDIMAEGPVIECIIEADSQHLVRYSRVVPISEPFNLPSQAHVTLEISGAKSKLARNISPGNFMIDDFFVKARDSFHFQLFSPDDTVKISDVMPSNIVLTKTDTLTQAIAGIGLTQVFSFNFATVPSMKTTIDYPRPAKRKNMFWVRAGKNSTVL